MKISIKQYAQTLFELTVGKSQEEISDIVKKFVEVLAKDGQLKNAGKIMAEFGRIYNKENGIVEAEVVSRKTLENENIEAIEKYVKEKYSAKEVVIRNVIDEKIQGGIIIRVADEVVDGSIAAQLKKMKKILSN